MRTWRVALRVSPLALRELVLKAQMGSELPVKAELERWFPLWGIPI